MESQQIQFMTLINYQNSEFYIPLYQRKYSWTIIQCKQLFDDILRLRQDINSKHFLGTVIYKKGNLVGNTLLEIVDSQQRITTISILLKALADYSKELNGGNNTTFYEKVMKQSLTNPFAESISKTKLKLTSFDSNVYDNLISNNLNNNDLGHPICANYNYFYNRIRNENPEEIYNLINRLMIIELSLGEHDDAQATFESVNSTGLRMEEADFIRNYIFINLNIRAQEEIYNNYWSKIENLFENDSKKLTEFLRIYLTIKCKDVIKETEVYEKFKMNFSKEDLNVIKNELESILSYARGYIKILKCNTNISSVNKLISEINKINIKPFQCVILKFYNDYENEKLTKDDLEELLNLIISYSTRRFFCNLPSNIYNKVSVGILNNIREKDYLYSVKRYLLTRQGSSRFPIDDEFKASFIVHPIYKKNKYLRNYVIYELENYNQNEILNIESSSLTLEHILPQNKNLSDAWKRDLGSKWKEVQNKYLHTIGNLTITGYNSRMSDKSFIEKRDMPNGFKECPARLNSNLRSLNKWNEKEIVKRANKLFDLAKEKWSFPEESLNINKPNNKVLTVNDNWSNVKINKVIFQGKEKMVNNTTEAYKFIIEEIYESNKENFINLVSEGKMGSKSCISYNKNDLHGQYFSLKDTGIYIGTKVNSNRKKMYVIKLLNIFQLNEDDIEFIEK